MARYHTPSHTIDHCSTRLSNDPRLDKRWDADRRVCAPWRKRVHRVIRRCHCTKYWKLSLSLCMESSRQTIQGFGCRQNQLEAWSMSVAWLPLWLACRCFWDDTFIRSRFQARQPYWKYVWKWLLFAIPLSAISGALSSYLVTTAAVRSPTSAILVCSARTGPDGVRYRDRLPRSTGVRTV